MIKKPTTPQRHLYPAILTDSLIQVQSELDSVAGIEGIEVFQVDVIDGFFADNLTITPVDLVELDFGQQQLDFHLMVEEPLDYVYEAIAEKSALPIRAIIAQVERMSHQQPFVQEVKQNQWQVGLSLDLYTPLEAIDEASWEEIHIIQLMGIEAGFQGQEFHQSILFKLAELRQLLKKINRNPEIIVDGGVKFDNIQPLLDAGADSVAIGSSLWQSDNAREAVAKYLAVLDQDS
jgi:ribulose-phosphate 3-epimerase